MVIIRNKFLIATFSDLKDCKHLITEDTEVYHWPKTYGKCYLVFAEFGLLGVVKKQEQGMIFIKKGITDYVEVLRKVINEYKDVVIGPGFYGMYDCISGMILIEKHLKETMWDKPTSVVRINGKLIYLSREKNAQKKFQSLVEDMRLQR